MQCIYFIFSSNQDQGELGNLVRGLVSTQAAWYFQKATWLKTTSWPRQNHCSLLGTEHRLGSFESQTWKYNKNPTWCCRTWWCLCWWWTTGCSPWVPSIGCRTWSGWPECSTFGWSARQGWPGWWWGRWCRQPQRTLETKKHTSGTFKQKIATENCWEIFPPFHISFYSKIWNKVISGLKWKIIIKLS